MANVDTPFGFRPIRHKSGAPYNGAANPYFLTNASNQAMFIGDTVLIAVGGSNGSVIDVVGAGSFAVGTLPEVLRAALTADTYITGVIVSFGADPVALENVHRLNSTERMCWVCDDPDVVFECQSDSAAALAAADVGLNISAIRTHSGSTTTGLSGMELDSGTENTTQNLQFTLQRAVNRSDNDATLVHAKWEVTINQHQRNPGNTGTLGI